MGAMYKSSLLLYSSLNTFLFTWNIVREYGASHLTGQEIVDNLKVIFVTEISFNIKVLSYPCLS